MDKLDKYLQYGEIKLFENKGIVYKKISDTLKENDNEKKFEYNEDLNLCAKNLMIFLGLSQLRTNNRFGLYDFISLPENMITLDNLRLLEGKYILLEWIPEGPIFFIVSQISCMKVYKYNDNMIYVPNIINPESGVFVKEYNSLHENLFIDGISLDWSFLTTDKLTKMHYYKFNDIDWNFKWKIWIPIPCYKEIYEKTKI